jgi:5-formyltetrahydrofolate cyclo-ligase
MSLFDLIKNLADAESDFVLVGGLAVALHGYRRVTMAVDVVLAMTSENLRRFIDCAKAAGLRPVIPVPIDALADPDRIDRWHREKGMLAFALRGPDMMSTALDVLVRPVVPFAESRRAALGLHAAGAGGGLTHHERGRRRLASADYSWGVP